ncbi:MAG: hypothetical protein NTZ80_03935 [Patescibacteria group bacterium]|nr:hypothetical protein [Patescibacteria group bacterium]
MFSLKGGHELRKIVKEKREDTAREAIALIKMRIVNELRTCQEPMAVTNEFIHIIIGMSRENIGKIIGKLGYDNLDKIEYINGTGFDEESRVLSFTIRTKNKEISVQYNALSEELDLHVRKLTPIKEWLPSTEIYIQPRNFLTTASTEDLNQTRQDK